MEAMPEQQQEVMTQQQPQEQLAFTQNSSNVQTEATSELREEFMMQQQHQHKPPADIQNPTNPFGEPYTENDAQNVQPQNPYGLV